MKVVLIMFSLTFCLALQAQKETVTIIQNGYGDGHFLELVLGGESYEVNNKGEILFNRELKVDRPILGTVFHKSKVGNFFIEPGATKVVINKKGFPRNIEVQNSKMHQMLVEMRSPKNKKEFISSTLKYIEMPMALEFFDSQFKFEKMTFEEVKSIVAQIPEEQLNLIPKALGFLDSEGKNKATIGDPIIDFSATDAQGNSFDTKQFRGKYMLLEFSSTSCTPCWMAYPDLIEVSGKYDNLQVLTFNKDENIKAWTNQATRLGLDIKWPVLWTSKTKAEVFLRYDIKSYPIYYLVSPEGKIIDKWFGSRKSKLTGALEKHITD